MKGKISNRKKKVSVVTKHKKWLEELQKTKEDLEIQEEEEKLQRKLEKEKVGNQYTRKYYNLCFNISNFKFS